jgi:hypothetical protein
MDLAYGRHGVQSLEITFLRKRQKFLKGGRPMWKGVFFYADRQKHSSSSGLTSEKSIAPFWESVQRVLV